MLGLSKTFLNAVVSNFKFKNDNKIYIYIKNKINILLVALKCMNNINYDEMFK